MYIAEYLEHLKEHPEDAEGLSKETLFSLMPVFAFEGYEVYSDGSARQR